MWPLLPSDLSFHELGVLYRAECVMMAFVLVGILKPVRVFCMDNCGGAWGRLDSVIFLSH